MRILLSILLLFATPLNAAELPPNAEVHLAEILMQPEFQPRVEERSMAAKLWESVQGFFGKKFNELMSWLQQNPLEGLRGTWFGRFLEALGTFLYRSWAVIKVLLIVGCAALLIGLLYFLIKPIIRIARPRDSEFVQGQSLPHLSEVGERSTLTELYQSRDYERLLERLRSVMREVLAGRYSLHQDTTDREVVRRLKKNAPEELLFRGIADAFESRAYATQSLNSTTVDSLYQRYLEFEKGTSQ